MSQVLTKEQRLNRFPDMPNYMKPMQYILTSEDTNNEDPILSDDQDNDFDDEDGDQRPTCGECGRELGPGWQCNSCRRNCPHCNRALTLDPDDFCERCFHKCPIHNHIYSAIHNVICPFCVQRAVQEEN